MRAAVDVMGGDFAPGAVLQGCWDAAPLLHDGDVVHLVGDQAVIDRGLQASGLASDKLAHYKIVPSTQVVGMDDPPVEAIRSKPDSSIAVMCKLASRGEADVVISAGNTGACVAAAQLRMRLLAGVNRPGIGVIVPTSHGPVVFCDVGANPEPKPKHLLQYAIMAGAYSTAVCNVKNPRVGLLSIGEEDAKGNTLVKKTRKLLKDEPLVNFMGNIEGRDLLSGVVDVVVCDGFVGNIVLKFIEGLVDTLFKGLAADLRESVPNLMPQLKPALDRVYRRHDWRDYGGAPLLGVDGYCLICHGRSDARAITSAIRVGKQLSGSGINEKIVQTIQRTIPVEED